MWVSRTRAPAQQSASAFIVAAERRAIFTQTLSDRRSIIVSSELAYQAVSVAWSTFDQDYEE